MKSTIEGEQYHFKQKQITASKMTEKYTSRKAQT